MEAYEIWNLIGLMLEFLFYFVMAWFAISFTGDALTAMSDIKEIKKKLDKLISEQEQKP